MSIAKRSNDRKRQAEGDHQRIRWVWRCNAAINDEPNEVTDREEHARFLYKKLEEFCGSFAFQLESAPTTGYEHYQGCMELSNKKRKRWILDNIFAFQYLAPMQGTPKQAWNYSTKLETRLAGPWTYGEPYGEDKKKPSTEFVNAIAAGMTDGDLVDHHPSCFLQYDCDKVRMAKKMKPNRLEKYGDKDIEVYLFYGDPGTGKSYAVRELYPDVYDVPPQNKGSFFITPDGSEAEVVLLEDFDGHMPLKDFNRYIDPYVMRVHVKGKFGWWCPRIVIITSNTLPSQWYDYDTRQDVFAQIKRRIRYCFDFNTPEGKNMTKGISVDDLEARYPNAKKRKHAAAFVKNPYSTPPVLKHDDQKDYKKMKLNLMKQQMDFFHNFGHDAKKMCPPVEPKDMTQSRADYARQNPDWPGAKQALLWEAQQEGKKQHFEPMKPAWITPKKPDVDFDEIDYQKPYGGFF
nr:MAG: replication associated protein [Cressdnaviricota sp.]